MVVQLPQSLRHYELVEQIGRGGMGAVWKAIDTRLDREVAIKVLPAEFAQDPERLARFRREARVLAALNHPGIVTLYSVESTGEGYFLVMELVRGKTLEEHLVRDGLPLETLLGIAIPLTDALAAAHARGVAHRDLKPRNVMIDENSGIKIVDFGLAAFRQQPDVEPSGEDSTTITRDNALMGTLDYMAPEQLLNQGADHRSDIFAVSVMLHQMATGRRPFTGANAPELIASILRDTPPSVADVNLALPRQLGRIIRHGLEKEPDRRFQTALDLRNELEDLRKEVASSAELTAGPGSKIWDPHSVAVLPLQELSGDPEQQFFADGMTDALIADLAGIAALRVISRTSVMRYKGVKKPLKEIARDLEVGTIVEGSVLRHENRVRITAELIDVRADRTLWARSYERSMDDILALQADVARAIVADIRVKLTPRERTRLERPRQVDPRTHEACLRGRYFWYQRTPETIKKGLRSFEEAVRIDPEYAPAYAGIADSYIVDGGRMLDVATDVAYSRARDAALKALSLDEELAEAHTSLAAVMTDYDWDWAGADREYQRAIQLNPGYVTAHSWYAEHLTRMGRFEQGIAEAKRARSLDPLSLITNTIVAWILFFARRYDEAIREARRTLELDPGFAAAYRILGWAYEETGQHHTAIEMHLRATELSGGSPNFKGQLGRAYALAGRADEAREILDELTELSSTAPISAFDICLIHLALGEPDAAWDWLAKAHAERSDHLPYIKVNPRLDRLRSDPRFVGLIQEMKLPD